MKQASPFKHLLLLSILLATSLPAFSQHFEWVKSYTGAEVSNSDDPTNRIIGSCIDSVGNFYILGEFSPQAQLCGERLLPMDVITTPIKSAVVIAKLSPSGDLLWHKAIYNGKESCYAYALRMVGDSSVMIMATLYLPRTNLNRNLYYLDTLLTGNDDYLMPTDSVTSTNYTAFITFDLDGNAIERHLVCVGFKDSNGNDITDRFRMGGSSVYSDKLAARGLSYENFNVDSEGNIYVVRSVHMDNVIGALPCDTCERLTWSISDGTIGALKIVVDGTHNLFYPIPSRTALWNQQILKFSPQFDSLLDAVYMFDSTLLYNANSPSFKIYSFEIDAQNNLYLNMEGRRLPGSVGIANSNSLHLGDSTPRPTWILKYNPQLEATGLVQLSFESSSTMPPQLLLLHLYIDTNTNSLFVPGLMAWSMSVDHTFYNHDTLDFANQTAFWLRLNKDDLRLLSYGQARPGGNGKGSVPHLAAYNNRVFAQVKFQNSMDFGDTMYNTPNSGDWDIGFVIWDYSGREVEMVARYGVSGLANQVNAPILKDSILYLTGSAYEDFTFGDITTYNYGYSQVFIAKYVDTAFMHPYLHPSDRQEQSIVWQQELSFNLADSPILLTAGATSGLPVVYSCGDSSIAYSDGSMLYLLRNGTTTVTASQQGDSDYLPAEPVTKTLQVNDVGTDALANSSPQIFPNPTSGMVTIDLAKTPPATPLPPKQPRRGDTSDINMVLYTSPGAPFSQTESANFPYHQRYNMKVNGPKLQSHDGIVTAWLTDMQGRREEVVLTPTGPERYTLDLTSRPPAAYLLTVTIADGRELTFRLMKQYGRR